MREYSVDIEARVERWPEGRDEVDTLEALLEELPRLGALGAIVHGRMPEVAGARFHVEADEPEKAVPAALSIFRDAAWRVGLALGEVEYVEAVTDERLRRDLEEPQDTYLGVSEVARLLGVSKQRVSELRSRPDFPAPVAELASGPLWRGSQLRRFVESWPRRPGRPRLIDQVAGWLEEIPVDALSPAQAEVVRALREAKGGSYEELARALGVSPATVRAHLGRIRRLMERIAEREAEGERHERV
ncbi:MAG TPA: helix-turn-helix domain-containing protein [Actinomycetota bacterium]|nr:helix-turn-helix domain-containing protein [Actinomycetota bacterium]